MRRLAWGAAFGLLACLGPGAGARADNVGELGERASFEGATVQPDGKAMRTLYGAKADSRDVLLGGRYPAPRSAQSFVKVLTTYSPPPKIR